MIDTPQIIDVPAQQAAIIHLTIPRSEIQTAMGAGIGEIMDAVKAQGIGPVGPWFTHHLKMDPATFDFEICAPVRATVTPVGRVKAGQWLAMRVARTVLRGGCENLGTAWGEFGKWLDANGYKTAPDLYECYVAGSEFGPDPANWRTELNKPLVA